VYFRDEKHRKLEALNTPCGIPRQCSESASGKSNGTRFVSAIAEIKKHQKPDDLRKSRVEVMMFHAGKRPKIVRALRLNNFVKLKLFAISRRPLRNLQRKVS